ncbi:MAG: thioredoxin domain-containing protein [Thiohalomonadaceae bacterium]|jgi:putative thioredoxin
MDKQNDALLHHWHPTTMNKQNPYIFNVTEEDFKEKVLAASHQQAILLDIWADWCSPCLALAPILDRVLTEYDGQVLLAKLDADEGENMRIAGQYQARGFPTVILFKNGAEIDRFTSTRPTQFIRDFLDQHLGA